MICGTHNTNFEDSFILLLDELLQDMKGINKPNKNEESEENNALQYVEKLLEEFD